MRGILFSIGLILAALTGVFPGFASASNPSENSKICPAAINQVEAVKSIPKNVLKAISHTESGRYDKNSKAFSAWPWTVNSQGKGYFFDSKSEAVEFVKSLQSKGVKSIDVGCMQINLHHHKTAFRDLDDAFDPVKNVTYAANFLQNLYTDNKSWLKAIGDYHSATPYYHEQYKKRVLGNLNRINTGKTLVQEIKVAQVYRPSKNTPQKLYDSTESLRSSVSVKGMTLAEADRTRKEAVMKAWEERKRRQIASGTKFINGHQSKMKKQTVADAGNPSTVSR